LKQASKRFTSFVEVKKTMISLIRKLYFLEKIAILYLQKIKLVEEKIPQAFA